MNESRRILLLMPTTTYRAQPFLDAAKRLGVEVLVGSDRCHQLAELTPIDSLPLDLRNPVAAAAEIEAAARDRPLDAIVPVDDSATLVAAEAAARLGLPHNSVAATEVARNKYLMRLSLAHGRVLSPGFRLVATSADPLVLAPDLHFPCVVKPLLLSGSRGVIRANGPEEFATAFRRVAALLRKPDVAHGAGEWAQHILVEDFIPGREVALEGLLVEGHLRVLAIFDKPDPLDGPFFEESIYVTPSDLSQQQQDDVAVCAEHAAWAVGIEQGPVHAELRLNQRGVWVVEIAARSIGGRCSQILRFGLDCTLEELILRHLLGLQGTRISRESRAAGVMMIPIPGAGVLRAVHGVEEVRKLPLIEDLEITAPLDQALVPLPEGASYLGFIFAKGPDPKAVVEALRQAHAELRFDIEEQLPIAWE